MRTACVLLAAVTLAATARAQGGMGGYNAMEIIYIGELKGGFDGDFEEMTGGVEIRLISDDPGLETLPIKARTMRFVYGDDKANPQRIIMEGGVNVAHPTAQVQADRAEWDFGASEMTFTGSVVMNNERMRDVRAESLTLDFESNRYRMSKVQADRVTLPQEDRAADPNLLAAGDVTDWSGLVSTFKQQAAADAPSPGRRIYSLLDAEAQRVLGSAPVDMIVGEKDRFLRQINGVLRNPGLYDEQAWSGVTVGEAARGLLAKAGRSPEETVLMNRWLVHAAYPAHIAAP